MRDGRPNPDIWGNIITCVEIGEGIYCIFGTDKKGIEMPKEVADELFPESVLTTGKEEPDGNVCFTDDVSNAIAVDILEKKGLIKTDKDLSVLDSLRQLDDPEAFTGFEQPITDIELEGLELE